MDIKIGIDLSLNSTGMCVVMDKQKSFYCIVPNKLTKKQAQEKDISYIIYQKRDYMDCSYREKEHIKTLNILGILKSIVSVLEKYKDCSREVYIEGVSYGSGNTRSIVELSALNYYVREYLEENKIKYNIISPSENKKNAVGNGAADKDLMIYNFIMLFPEYQHWIDNKIKIDDLVDAYFLTCN